MRAADDFDAIGARLAEIEAARKIDPRRAEVYRLAKGRGLAQGMTVPDDIFIGAGYTQAEIDEIRTPVNEAFG